MRRKQQKEFKITHTLDNVSQNGLQGFVMLSEDGERHHGYTHPMNIVQHGWEAGSVISVEIDPLGARLWHRLGIEQVKQLPPATMTERQRIWNT